VLKNNNNSTPLRLMSGSTRLEHVTITRAEHIELFDLAQPYNPKD